MSSPLSIVLFRRNSNYKDPILSITFGWDSGTDNALRDSCYIMSALSDMEDCSAIDMVRKLNKTFPLSGLATHPSWFTKDKRELEKVLKLVSSGLREGKNRNDGLIGITPNAIENIEAYGCRSIYLMFKERYSIIDFLDEIERSELDKETIEEARQVEDWMKDRFSWDMALSYYMRFVGQPGDIYFHPTDKNLLLIRSDY
ncbi:MAG: hypothetical protein K6G51_06015 [Sphaerochaetaceae bacterium]|nr:hypothetical protein [Sphaerochaetaceae bacterium]